MQDQPIDYESDVTIDETSLDVEWLEQPRLMLKYAREAAHARAEADKAKERLEVTRAELDRNIRHDPDGYGIGKITETVVQNTIVAEDAYRKAHEEFIDAQHEAEMARYAVRAMEQRKDALENLVRLHGQQYFAGPRVPRDLQRETEAAREARQKRVDKKVGARMTRGKKKGGDSSKGGE